MAHRDVPRVDQGCAAGALVGQRAGETSPQTNPGESNLCCTHFHSTLLCGFGGQSEPTGVQGSLERAPCPSEGSHPQPWLSPVAPAAHGGSALAQDTLTPFTQPPQGWLGSVQDVEAAHLFWFQSCTKPSVTALLEEKPFSLSSTLCLSKQEAVTSLKGDSISAQ